jgi:hypothetical protein
MDIRAVLIVLLSLFTVLAFTCCDNCVINKDTTPTHCINRKVF